MLGDSTETRQCFVLKGADQREQLLLRRAAMPKSLPRSRLDSIASGGGSLNRAIVDACDCEDQSVRYTNACSLDRYELRKSRCLPTECFLVHAEEVEQVAHA